ncbi:glycosyltransferase family 4 protein [Sphaerospermopsis aphanizomenoides BCCUSP55]|uniref:glycosyltransferase family 4 protein n=1 Tax=Sphaerospermopsis aphanizomenoides TaxID=459663 RepID=UPI000A3EC592|nr:glycosyltransferase family 4 protein [Sphaerospermopsis aphanizomenoides]MBK1987206.1 glycosyltransferase family 4 protein [Sphaerospermopsis aphanizomenoides BCCUSP55]
MKISILVSDLSSAGAGRWGGGSVRSFLLAQALQKLNYQVEILGFVFGEAAAIIPQSEIQVNHFVGYNYPKFLISASGLLKKLDGDIIYAMRPKSTTFGLALLKKFQTNRPVILDIDDWELSWYGGEKWQYQASIKQLYRDILKSDGALRQPDHPFYLKIMEGMTPKADAITIHTKFLQKRFGGIYLPNGKDTELFNPHHYDSEASRICYGLSGYRILMFPGAPRPYKGVEDVLMALELLNEPDLRLVIVGGSPYDDYDAQLSAKWGRWIIKLPKYPPTEMPKIVAAAHIVVVPQRNTPAALAQFPLKLTDGMSMAKPILATRMGDMPEILGGTGYLVEPESPEQIATTIKLIFRDLDVANQNGVKARERCVDKYSINSMSAILESVINNL